MPLFDRNCLFEIQRDNPDMENLPSEIFRSYNDYYSLQEVLFENTSHRYRYLCQEFAKAKLQKPVRAVSRKASNCVYLNGLRPRRRVESLCCPSPPTKQDGLTCNISRQLQGTKNSNDKFPHIAADLPCE